MPSGHGASSTARTREPNRQRHEPVQLVSTTGAGADGRIDVDAEMARFQHPTLREHWLMLSPGQRCNPLWWLGVVLGWRATRAGRADAQVIAQQRSALERLREEEPPTPGA